MKSGYVAVIGRANAGKSTLINVLVGEKVSIVSPKPQTTRNRILGVFTDDKKQICFVDTPGLYRADNLLSAVIQKTAEDTAKDVDMILFVLDAHAGVSEADKRLLNKFKDMKDAAVPFAVVLSKIDITPENLLISEVAEIGKDYTVIPVSARRGKNLKELLKVIEDNLPEGDRIFEQDIVSDKSERFMVSEIMREKILLKFQQEIPHGVAIVVNRFALRESGDIYDIDLDIICEKAGHKAILIGKRGEKLKEVSSFAREAMEKFLGKKVFLKTFVKVEEGWRDSVSLMKKCGYAEED